MILSENTTLTGNGIGNLTDAVSAIVTHEINGQYELMMTYPVTGIHYSELAQNRIIWAEPDNMTAQQAFRIYRITRPLNGIVTVYARHIAYDMSGIIAEPYTASSLQTALSGLASHCVPSCPFTFTTARAVASPFKVSQPTALWSLLGGQQGSFLDVYGGEWAFDNFAATLTSHLGSDRGVAVRYGKNMTELEQDLTIEATYVGIYPFWYDEETDTLVTLPEKYISTTGTGSRILILDCSGDFETQPTVAQLRTRAQSYITANNIGEPQISWKVSFAQLAQDPQYADIAALEQVQLGDTIHIFYEPMNLEASSRAVKIEYDVLMKRYRSVTLGRVKQNLAAIVAGTSQEIQKAVSASRTAIDRAIENSTEFIKNGTGYMRFIYNDAGDLMEIVSLNNPDINQAQKVWRWNNGGFGFSASGYNGPYTTAITQDGSIVADFITTGTLNAARIKAGILEDEAGKFSLNLVTGELHIEQLDVVAEKLSNIGGRNYAWAISADYHTPTTLSYVTSTYNPDNNGEYAVTATRAGASDQNSPQTYTPKYPVPSELLGTECVFHVDAIEPSNSATNPQVGLLLYDSSDTQFFTRYLQNGTMSRDITIPTNAATMRIDIFVDANKVNAVGDYVTVRGIKLERGTVATDWSPAPEDQAGYADHTASAQIVVATNNIISTVSDTYETKADASIVNLMPSIYYREANSENPWESPSGITWKVKPDGSIVATGTATAESVYSIANSSMSALVPPIKVDPTRDYTISGVPGITGCRLYFVKYDASGTQIGSQGYIQSAPSAVISAGADYISCFAYIVSGTALPEGGVTFRPQLEVGKTAHGYISTHNGSYSMRSQIVQNATSISSKVSKESYNGETIASLINQSADTVQIEAQHINLVGAVTISSLDSTAQAALLSNTTVKTQYYLSTSTSSAKDGTWYDSPNSITWESGKYVWTRVATTKTNASGTSSTTYSTEVYDKQLTSALSTAAAAATAAGNAQTTANATVTEAVPIYYRSMSSTTPTLVPGETYVYTTDNTDDQWSAVAPRPKRGAYFWEAVRYTLGDGSRAYSLVRALTSEQYASKWVSTADSSYIDGGSIYANSITAAQIAAGTITADRINLTDLFTQNITATNMNITGGSVAIDAGSDQTTSYVKITSDYGTTGITGNGINGEDENGNHTITIDSHTGNIFLSHLLQIGAVTGGEDTVFTMEDASGNNFITAYSQNHEVRIAGSSNTIVLNPDNYLYYYSSSAFLRIDPGTIQFTDGTYNRVNITQSGITLRNASGAFASALSGGSLSLGSSAVSGLLSVTDGTKTYSLGAANGLFMYAGTNQYSALIWPDSNGAGRLVLGDGTSTTWRTELTNSGLVFRNASDAVTGNYPASGMKATDLKNSVVGTLPASGSRTITFNGQTVALISVTSGYQLGYATYLYNGYGVSNARQHIFELVAGSSITYTISSSAQSVTISNAIASTMNLTVVVLYGANAPTLS